MQGVLFVDIIDPKAVDTKGEGDGVSCMEIQARSILRKEVPSNGKDFFELLVGKFTSLFETVHDLLDFNVDEILGGDFGSKVVVLDDVSREIGIGDPYVLKPAEGSAGFARIVSDEISASRYLSPIGIFFFRPERANSASKCDSATSRDLMLVDEEDGIRAFAIARREPLS